VNHHRVASRRSPAPEPGAENTPIPSLVEGLKGPEDWMKRRRPELLRQWLQILGKVAPAPENLKWFGDITKAVEINRRELEGYTRVDLDIPIEADFYQRHLLLLPKGQGPGPFPAVIAWTSSTPDYREPELWWGGWLARNGFVVLTSWSFIRNYRQGSRSRQAAGLVYERFGYWLPLGKMVHDVTREIEYLRSLPQVDRERIGFMGFSLGAKAAVYAAAFQPDLKATVALDPHIAINGGTNWYDPWYLDWGRTVPGAGQTVQQLLNPDPARPGFEHDHHELLALVAPRAFLLIGGSQSEDAGGDSDDLQSWGYVNRAREVYRLLGVPERLQFASTGEGHRANGPQIDAAWQGFFRRLLGPGQALPAANARAHDPQSTTGAGVAEGHVGHRRVELNIVGATDSEAGESRRNENVHFNPIDNNALKDLNVRLGTTATIVQEFRPDRSYFGSEFGNVAAAPLHVPAGRAAAGFHGRVWESHVNSVFSARSFFQVGDVKPARENDYGFQFGLTPWRGVGLAIDGSQQKLRGSVNGNVLVPRPDERTPLAADPATRAIVGRFLSAYPRELPNRTDIHERALNTNSPQVIDNHNAGLRLDQRRGDGDRWTWEYLLTAQTVKAFQLVAGQNPDTDTKFHKARLTWNRTWSPATVTDLSAGFERLGSLLLPESNAVGPMVITSGLETLGPQGSIPINRALNLYRYAGQAIHSRGPHAWTAGFSLLRRQLNGSESDAHRGFLQFSNDFGREAVTNLRLGTPFQYILSTGNVHRGFRNWEPQFFAGDDWRAASRLSMSYGLRYQPVAAPVEVNRRNVIPYDCDCNNLAPRFGFAYQLPHRWGVLRGAYGLHYGEIFPATFGQVRFSPPGSLKVVVPAPTLVNPLGGADPRGNLYLLDAALATPYSHQYNFSWEPEVSGAWKIQLGYVGSRSHKLLNMWYLNRAHPVAGIPLTTATINQRRPDPGLADIRYVVNGSRGYFDAARVSLVVPRWRGLSLDAAYWLSKALDLGSSYTNTAHDNDSRLARSQSEFEAHRDMKALSAFDQPHAFLARGSYQAGGWTLSAVALVKSGTPFNVQTGSDALFFGNVDGSGSDRPNLLDASILGRSLGDPDTSRRRLPRAAFSFIRPAEERGNLGRNVFRKGGIGNVNAALARAWKIRSGQRLTLRAESINFFNTPQFAEPGFELTNANFGLITNTLNEGRTFRFRLEFGW